MFTSFANMRGPVLAVVFLVFLCSLLLATEFDLVVVSESVSTGNRPQKLRLEELVTLSGIFSLVLAVLAFLNGRTAARERQARTLIEREAHLDPLTGLPNRRLFRERLESALARSREGDPCAVLLIDLDRFKQVNDTLGHAAGDMLLVEVARRLRLFAQAPEDAARLGGDEFALILRLDAASKGNARAMIARLEDSISRPVDYLGHLIEPAASIGLAIAKPGAARTSELLEAADADMYCNKQRRRCQLVA